MDSLSIRPTSPFLITVSYTHLDVYKRQAMDNKIPYTYFSKQIFTHPTLAENLNDLFAI